MVFESCARLVVSIPLRRRAYLYLLASVRMAISQSGCCNCWSMVGFDVAKMRFFFAGVANSVGGAVVGVGLLNLRTNNNGGSCSVPIIHIFHFGYLRNSLFSISVINDIRLTQELRKPVVAHRLQVQRGIFQ